MSVLELSDCVDSNVKISANLIHNVGNIISTSLPNIDTVHIITDTNVASLHLRELKVSLLASNITNIVHSIEAGEKSKSFTTLEFLLDEILSFHPSRNTIIIAFGGGVVGDVAGVVASMLLRGVRLVHIPTTLIAQVDSAIGGKTAINTTKGKNLVGTMHTAQLVLIDVSLLDTLPRKELVNGYAEVVKYAACYDENFFTWVHNNTTHIINKDVTSLLYVVKFCCAIKINVVKEDRYGNYDRRIILNFGHTIGHAIESATNHLISHGEAVSIGMVIESTFSKSAADQIKTLLQQAGLPTSLKEIDFNWDLKHLYSYILHDKKIKDKELPLIALHKIGKPYIKYVSCNFMHHLLSNFLH